MMKEQFVPYDQALKLKELGFNEECFGYYDNWLNHGKEKITFRLGLCKGDVNVVSAPLWQQAFDWFREKYGCFELFDYQHGDSEDNKGFFFNIINTNNEDFFYPENFENQIYKTYQEAREACLEKLIEIIKNENKS